jgi:hypothetical protein
MDSLQAYGSSGEDDSDAENNKEAAEINSAAEANSSSPSFRPVPIVQRADRRYLNPAPSVSLTTKALTQLQKYDDGQQHSSMKRKRSGVGEHIVMLSNNPKQEVL